MIQLHIRHLLYIFNSSFEKGFDIEWTISQSSYQKSKRCDHRISIGIECALGHVTGVYFYKTFCPYKSAILDLSILLKNELSSNFSTKLSSNKKISNKFLCEEDKFFSNNKSSGEFSCPYKFAILWRHVFNWHEIGARILDLLVLWLRLTVCDNNNRLRRRLFFVSGIYE